MVVSIDACRRELEGPIAILRAATIIDDAAVPGRRYYMRSNFINNFTLAAIEALADAYSKSPSHFNAVIIAPFGGAVARVPAQDTAFFYRDSHYSMTLLGAWLERKRTGFSERSPIWVATLKSSSLP